MIIKDRPTQLRVDLDALLNNYNKLNSLNNEKIGLAVVKADSYGLGSKVIAEHLYQNGVRHFATATLEEALELKDVNTTIGYLKYRKKDGYRTIALNKESVDAIENYIVELKKEYPNIKDDSKLFLNHDGEGISRQGFWKIFKKRLE